MSLPLSFRLGLVGAQETTGKLDAYENLSISGQGETPCTAAISTSSQQVQCTFALNQSGSSYNSPSGSSIFSKINPGSCDAVENAGFKTSEATSGSATTDFLNLTVDATEKNCDGPVEKEGKMVCKVSKTFCARADLVVSGESSVIAGMLNGVVDFYYATDGTFTSTISTSAFNPESASASETRTVDVSVTRGSCGSAQETGNLAIGSTLNLCVFAADADVQVTSLKSVSVTPYGGTGTEIISVDSSNNFVTTTDASTDGVTISTLMIPTYYDAQNGAAGSVTVSGTAMLTYSRRVLTARGLQVEEETAPFEFEVPLESTDLPKIAEVDEESGANFIGVGMAGFAIAGAIAVF